MLQCCSAITKPVHSPSSNGPLASTVLTSNRG
jgi:hypothetical protein